MRKARRFALAWMAVALSAAVASCGGTEAGQTGGAGGTDVGPAQVSAAAGSAGEIAEKVAEGIGSVGKSGAGEATSPILVLEEEHTSPTVRLEEAIALVRLYRDHGLRTMGIEGAEAGQVIDAPWFYDLAEIDVIKPGVAVALLGQGEINAGEFTALVFPDVRVVGMEDPKLYAVAPPKSSGEGAAGYFLRIAVESLTLEQQEETLRLLQTDEEKAAEYILSQDPWVVRMRSRIEEEMQSNSIENVLAMYEDIKQRAESQAVEIPEEDRKKMEEEIAFLTTAMKRSDAMVQSLCSSVATEGAAPTAMVIGAGHTDRCCALLARRRANFAVISPASLPEEEASDLPQEAYDRKLARLPVSAEHLGSLLLDYLPRPVLDQPWFQKKTKIYYVAAYLARLSATGSFPPSAQMLDDLSRTTGIEVDRSSLRLDANQVVFTALVPTQTGGTKTIHGRTVRVSAVEVAGLSRADATEKLLQEELKRLKSEKKHPNDLVELVAPGILGIFSKSVDGVVNAI